VDAGTVRVRRVTGKSKASSGKKGRGNWLRKRKGLGRDDTRGFFVGRHGAKGSIRQKKPPPGHNLPEGAQYMRRLDTIPHGALTSEAAYPLQSSSLQGLLLHEYSCPTPWIFAPTHFNIVPPLPHLSRG
jgi:hypothetical protein